MRKPVKVTITYCAECGYGHEAIALAKSLMDEFQLWLSSIELIPYFNGAYEVMVDGEMVHSMYRDGGFAEFEQVADAVRSKVGNAA